MSDWINTTLGNVAKLRSGGTPSKDVPAFWDGTIPWVSAKDMKTFRLYDTEDHLSDEGLQNGSRIIQPGTVLILSRGMTLLRDVPICVATRSMAFNQDVRAVVANPGVLPEFLAYSLLAHKDELLSMVDLAGHGTGRLNSDELKDMEIPLPPLPEQRAIAHILGTLDDKMELNRRMNETLEDIARALFKSWFVDFDPVHAKAEGREPYGMDAETAALFPDSFEDSELGPIPSGWRIRSLDEIARFLNGLALQKYPVKDGHALPVIKIAQLHAGNTVGADSASADLPPEYVVEDGDVLFSWSGSLECVIWSGGQGALNQHLFKVTSKEFPKWFYYLWIHQHLREFRHVAAGKATTMGHIQRHHLSDAKVLVPQEDLLVRMDGILRPIADNLQIREMESRTAGANRDALLPKLISGGLRVQTKEQAVAEAIP